jgi:hypothetical protein
MPLAALTPGRRPALFSSPGNAKRPTPLIVEEIQTNAAENSPTLPPRPTLPLSLEKLELEPVQEVGEGVPNEGALDETPVERPAASRASEPAPTQKPERRPEVLDPALFDLSGPADYDVGGDDLLAEVGTLGAEDHLGATRLQPGRRSRFLGPLLTMNAAFDRGADWLGPLGRWLTAPATRNFLGWLGIMLLLAAAALYFGAWLGWTW